MMGDGVLGPREYGYSFILVPFQIMNRPETELTKISSHRHIVNTTTRNSIPGCKGTVPYTILENVHMAMAERNTQGRRNFHRVVFSEILVCATVLR